ncbi:Odorant receptor 13a [Anthophora quadrimaculata]
MKKISKEIDASVTSAYSKVVKKASYTKDFALSMTAILMKITGLWLAKDKKEERKRLYTLIYTIIAILFGVWVQIRDFYYSWPNFSDCAYTACNILSLVMVLLKVTVIIVHKKKFIDLLKYAYKNFWHINYDYNELLLLKNCRTISTRCITLITFCCQGTVVSYVIAPISINIANNGSDRVLPFNMWVNLPLSVSPWYELMFTAQVLSLYHIGVCYICFDNLLCLINLHAATQFRILQYRLTNLSDTDTRKVHAKDVSNADMPDFMENCYKRFKSCVQQHQNHIMYCHRLNDIFTVIVLGHILVFSILMCLVGFQVLLADSPPAKRLIFIFHLSGSFCQLLLFTYSCDGLIEESTNVGTAVYCGPWLYLPMDKAGRMLRKDLTMVIIRSKKPCCLTASGFFPVSLETCTTVLSTAMSYFTLLRQSVV